ncbi:LPXTG cell wall anchor domain-containing protein [Aeromicrobium sp. 9AM]|uniref:LPXTG cell wall anchor domain-containing protein n=1 Tax=Aeromicrobium sp. 9AM TaxID=2653126 RepID=UPI0012F0FB7C|nr:LPXTG cell wall anchor domain-containing protein [Aeromicrobium sp. 9AM]VXB52525.1 conserved exported hypothetical protein [Aeromicrobium sp. 9AM]
MPKTRLAFAIVVAALLSVFAASAANAAYSPPPFSADVPSGVAPGEEFSVTFDAGSTNCAWTLSPFNGQSAPAGSGSTYTVTLTAPDSAGTYTITAHCTWDPATVNPSVAAASDPAAVTPAVFTTSVSSDTLLAVPQTDTYSVQLVVSKDGDANTGDDTNGALPDTGGSNLTLLGIGAGLAVAGAAVTVAARRRKTA